MVVEVAETRMSCYLSVGKGSKAPRDIVSRRPNNDYDNDDHMEVDTAP